MLNDQKLVLRKSIHRILGILLSTGISFGILLLFVDFADPEKINNFYCRVATGFATLLFIFGLPAFLSSLFTPKPKKYGAIAGMLIACLFLLFLTFYRLFFDEGRPENLSPDAITGLFACFNGVATGFIVSYLVFKNKGWGTASEEVATPETH